MKKLSLLFTAWLLLLPGCARYTCWCRKTFEQAEGVSIEAVSKARCFIRAADVYDEFNTVGRFAVLPLNKEVRRLYTALYAERRGLSEIEEECVWSQQRDELATKISFYIAAANPYDTKPQFDSDNDQAHFTISLCLGDICYEPVVIKPIALSREYQAIFGEYYTRFRTVYLVEFDLDNKERGPIIADETSCMKIILRSIRHRIRFSWP